MVVGEIVNRDVYRVALLKLNDVLAHERCVERVRVVKIDGMAVNRGNVAKVFIVSVVRYVGDVVAAHTIQNGIGNGGLARSTPPGDGNRNGAGTIIHRGFSEHIEKMPALNRAGTEESHLWDLNPKPNAYEAFALPLS